jgi:hypothetical protein
MFEIQTIYKETLFNTVREPRHAVPSIEDTTAFTSNKPDDSWHKPAIIDVSIYTRVRKQIDRP